MVNAILCADDTKPGQPAGNTGGLRITMFDKFHITFASAVTAAALGMFALPFAPSPASANICTDFITTTWTAPGATITQNGTGFTACDLNGNGSSTLAGQVGTDSYSVTVSAINNDTFQLTGSIYDLGGTDGSYSPYITLEINDIDWVDLNGDEMNGYIDSVIATPGYGTFYLASFTNDTITITGDYSCSGTSCSITGGDLGSYRLVANHVVPLPAALPLFLSALAGLGLMGWRRRHTAA